MKKISNSLLKITLFIFALFLSATAYSQPPQSQQGHPPMPDDKEIAKIVDDLSDEISLSAEQEAKISALYFSHFDKLKVLTENNKRKDRGSREDQEAMDNVKADFEHEIKAILSDKQQKQFDAYQKKNQPQRSKGRKPSGRS